jgi:hypothetical protein
MRLWSIHPKYLDVKGLTACWREGLLAQNVLLRKTRGYKNHPQLERFKNTSDPVYAICSYLYTIYEEAKKRGYKYSVDKIAIKRIVKENNAINVSTGQIQYEFEHLKGKLKIRDPERLLKMQSVEVPEVNPLFKPIEGVVESWEKV